MRCPKCGSEDIKVLDTRGVEDGSIRRRRFCNACKNRFSTFEKVEELPIYVIKKDKGRVLFDREKLLRGLKHASIKRNVSMETLQNIVTKIERKIQNSLNMEVHSKDIGDMALEFLREVDQVAYVRFASVYKEFDDIKSFIELVEALSFNKENRLKIVFMGTPFFAKTSLEKLYESDKYEIVAVYTKIDKRNGRGNTVNYSPVKNFALEKNLKLFQIEKFDSPAINDLKALNPDLIVVVAYGKILPKEVIEIPKYGAINLHSSLLPKYRGAAPINAAIMNGDSKTGVTVMEIVKELDAGPIILQKKVKIEEEDNFLSLHDKLKEAGGDLLLEAIELIEKSEDKRIKQDENLVSFVKPFKKEDLKIDWNLTKEEIYNFVRALAPTPTAYTFHNDKVFKIYELMKSDTIYQGENGQIVAFIKGKGFVIKVKNGSLIILSAKPENKKILSGTDLINGKILNIGDILC